MSAIGTKRTWLVALHMSAFGGKADMAFCGKSAFAVAFGCKADMPCFALQMSAFDPKRTSGLAISRSLPRGKMVGFWHWTSRVLKGTHATARFHQSYCWLRSCLAARGARAAACKIGDRISEHGIPIDVHLPYRGDSDKVYVILAMSRARTSPSSTAGQRGATNDFLNWRLN